MQIIKRIHHDFSQSIPRKIEETEVQYKNRVTRLGILDDIDPIVRRD